ncbi:MAG: hypothetical protein JXN64_08335, partial [Spirochaetes bacterium]|nr:hypothetical protein [Spirochaetota bacterium]
TAKDITGFSILGIPGTIGANSILLTVPYGTSITSLTPTITITGASVSPASGVARNFTNPVTYTVTAADGTTKTYTVTVTDDEAGTIYWTEVGGAIKNIHNDGTGEVTLLTVTGTPLDIALDISGNQMYWTEYTGTAYQIRRAGIDGSNPALFAEYSSSGGNRFGPTAIAIDSGTSRIYWNHSQLSAGQEYLYYSSLNSYSAVQWTSSVPNSYVHSLCVDTTRRGFYFNANTYWNISFASGSGRTGAACYSSTLDILNSHSTPINETELSPSSTRLRGIAVGGDYIYYVYNNSGGLRIVRARYDFQETNDPWITAGTFGIQKIALDLNNNKIYWTSDTNNSIYRADLGTANSNIVQFRQLSNKPTSIAITQ